MEIKKNVNLWDLLSTSTDFKIVIPDYQRDYAQGRTGDGKIDEIRTFFVNDLIAALEKGTPLSLGLIYGSYKNEQFIAVDGQQRLTTLFLLHWYLLFSQEKRNAEDIEILSRFTWKTRRYATEFVLFLMKLLNPNKVKSDAGLLDFFKYCPEYFEVWKCDPTVKSMLTMLGAIDEMMKVKADPDQMTIFWSQLTNKTECKIIFDILPQKDFEDETMYIKMNSRGRSLTVYENFKAKFIEHIKPIDQSLEKEVSEKLDQNWIALFDSILSNMGKEYIETDVYMMNFFNEMTLLVNQGENYPENHFIDMITNGKCKGIESDLKYISFDLYSMTYNKKETVVFVTEILDWIDRYYNDLKKIHTFKKVSLINQYVGNEISYTDRAYFYALLRFMVITEFKKPDLEKLKSWMRVWRNLIYNTDIDKDGLKNAISSINKMENIDIYVHLSKSPKIPFFNQKQSEEECYKARHIINDINFENVYDETEKEDDFKGTIRLLLRNMDDVSLLCPLLEFNNVNKLCKDYYFLSYNKEFWKTVLCKIEKNKINLHLRKCDINTKGVNGLVSEVNIVLYEMYYKLERIEAYFSETQSNWKKIYIHKNSDDQKKDYWKYYLLCNFNTLPKSDFHNMLIKTYDGNAIWLYRNPANFNSLENLLLSNFRGNVINCFVEKCPSAYKKGNKTDYFKGSKHEFQIKDVWCQFEYSLARVGILRSSVTPEIIAQYAIYEGYNSNDSWLIYKNISNTIEYYPKEIMQPENTDIDPDVYVQSIGENYSNLAVDSIIQEIEFLQKEFNKLGIYE